MSRVLPALAIDDLNAWYGESHVLHGISLRVETGEIVTLLGRNGAGKTTTMKCIMGLIAKRTGSISINGIQAIGLPSRKIARAGMGYVPEDRGIYASMNVRENLLLPPVIAEGGITLDEIYELFPNLRARLDSQGTKLSGGEQQMLAMARVLRTGARTLLLDEPTEGLAPVIVEHIHGLIRRLKARGFTILLVEQNYRFATTLADRHYIVEEGRVVDQLDNDELLRDEPRVLRYLGV